MAASATDLPAAVKKACRLWRLEREMKMISHDRIRVQSPTVMQAHFSDRLLEGSGRSDRFEYATPVVASIDDMTEGIGLDSQPSSHIGNQASVAKRRDSR